MMTYNPPFRLLCCILLSRYLYSIVTGRVVVQPRGLVPFYFLVHGTLTPTPLPAILSTCSTILIPLYPGADSAY